MRFADHKYTWSRPFKGTVHGWSFRGPRGGIDFHVHTFEDGDFPTTAGLEIHRAYDPSGGEEAASHAHCWLLKAPCWHDGTSLYATETLWPIVQSLMPDHAAIFRVLEREYDHHFEHAP